MAEVNAKWSSIMPDRPVVMTIAGHDPSGGAGIQADIESIHATGAFPVSVLTCLTIQDTHNVKQLLPVDADTVYQQAKTLLDDIPVQVFKLGLLGTVEVVATVASLLEEYPDIPVVYDPVLAAGGGKDFSSERLIECICTRLLPKVSLLTPNLPEAIRLVQEANQIINDQETSMSPLFLAELAKALYALGCESVLLTGTHNETQQVNNSLYFLGEHLSTMTWDRLPYEYHGSGCTLAANIAGELAIGQDLQTAVEKAQQFTWHSLRAAYALGKGQRHPNRLKYPA
jgi:hydroxymethylpyrimidine/phosphomethylpyrimidine kinase